MLEIRTQRGFVPFAGLAGLLLAAAPRLVKDLDPATGWSPSNRTCANSCHGTERW